MNRDTYRTIRKHFLVIDQRALRDRYDPSYHPLQNILQGTLYLGDKSRELWIHETEIIIEEGWVKSKSKHYRKYRNFT